MTTTAILLHFLKCCLLAHQLLHPSPREMSKRKRRRHRKRNWLTRERMKRVVTNLRPRAMNLLALFFASSQMGTKNERLKYRKCFKVLQLLQLFMDSFFLVVLLQDLSLVFLVEGHCKRWLIPIISLHQRQAHAHWSSSFTFTVNYQRYSFVRNQRTRSLWCKTPSC